MEHKEEANVVPSQRPTSLDELWQQALSEIEIQISRPNFLTWFKNTNLFDKRDFTAFIALPNNFAKEWIENRYQKVVLGALRALDEEIKKVCFVVQQNTRQTPTATPHVDAIKHPTQLTFPEMKLDPETNLNPRYTLSSFVVGRSNELAYAAATAVIDSIGTKYNPFFIYGGVGLGKTHLMQALGNEIRTRYQNRVKVKYVSSEKFTNEVIWAINNKRMDTIKEKYRFVDVLIIDDVQFIAGKARTEEEFFHTFNSLYENNKQIILSSDKPPKFMPNLEERLRSRFEGGMIADIGYPDYELRCAILKAKLQERGARIAEEVVSLIANKIQRNFRELEGVLTRIIFHQTTKGAEVTARIAEQIINDIIQEPTLNVSPKAIIKAVADIYEVSPADLTGQCRKKEVVEPRQIAMYLLRDYLSLSYPSIGEKMGKRDHTTAIYAYEKIAQEINRNQLLNQKILMIKEMVTKE